MACTLCGFSAPAAPAKTPLFTAREPLWPLWRSKWPLGPARVLLEGSEGFSGPALAPPVRSKWPLFWPAQVPPVRSKRLLKPASMLKMPILACSGATSVLKKPARARLSATECAQRGCSSLLFEITIRKCWSRLHSALSHFTLFRFASCMDMHGFTLVYIYI